MYGTSTSMSNNPNPNIQTQQQAANEISAALSDFFISVEQRVTQGNSPVTLNLSPTQLSLYLSQLKSSSIVILDVPPAKLKNVFEQTKAWQSLLNPSKEWHLLISPLETAELSGEVITETSRAMHALLQSTTQSQHSFFITPEILQGSLPNQEEYIHSAIRVSKGEAMSMKQIITRLTEAGYTRHQSTNEPGTFRVSGEKIDITHPIENISYTLHWYGPTIERIIQTASRRSQDISALILPPLKFPQPTPYSENMFASTIIIKSSVDIVPQIPAHITVRSLSTDIPFPLTSGKSKEASQTILFYTNYDRALAWTSREEVPSALLCPHTLATYPIDLSNPTLRIISETSAIPLPKTSTSPISVERARELVGQLTPGKPAVHADHGIGIFEGLETRTISGSDREYIVLRYAEGDALSVPVEFAHKVTPYIGQSQPGVHRLGGTLWQKTRAKAQHDAVAFAQELLAISRARTGKERSPYEIHSHAEDVITQNFPFTLTADQATSLQEVTDDLKKPIPMDRLIVGDVGFGKTEIAIRAATHAVHNNRQVAIIAPTTLLVEQHTDTFQQRLSNIKPHIHQLSRFISAKQKRQTIEDIESGKAKIVIGTHALLSKNIKWQNLGLVVIDEEQRFGVRHKEHFKKIRASVDVLSLSATPIPRTLSMALSGLRQLSIITTPPPGRQDVITAVGKINDTVIKEALERELKRHGQAYVVAPKVRQLAMIKEHIAALVPNARIAVAHGQMDERQLTQVIHAFDAQEIDILVSSSIIEHGLDLPLTNTMIVWDALRFGLADLYQLRGRIGRRKTQGYAYFLYNQTELTSNQRARLTALIESQRLGSGWLIAQRDLEIRGAGNLLGAEQHGGVNAIGVQLYLDLVNQAVEDHDLFTRKVDLELPLPTALPPHYIADMAERTRQYQRLTRARTLPAINEISQNIQNVFGPLPPESQNLILLIKLQRVAAAHHITFIGTKDITPSDEEPYQRLQVRAESLAKVLPHLGSLGNWRVRGTAVTLDLESVTSQTIEKLISALSS